MPKHVDPAFSAGTIRAPAHDALGRETATGLQRLYQLPVDHENHAPATVVGPPPAPPVVTDADRMDWMRARGYSEAMVCKLSKTPGVLEIVVTHEKVHDLASENYRKLTSEDMSSGFRTRYAYRDRPERPITDHKIPYLSPTAKTDSLGADGPLLLSNWDFDALHDIGVRKSTSEHAPKLLGGLTPRNLAKLVVGGLSYAEAQGIDAKTQRRVAVLAAVAEAVYGTKPRTGEDWLAMAQRTLAVRATTSGRAIELAAKFDAILAAPDDADSATLKMLLLHHHLHLKN